MYGFWPITYFNYIFHVKIQLSVTKKSDQDPRWFGVLDPDPDPHWSKCGSTKLVFINYTSSYKKNLLLVYVGYGTVLRYLVFCVYRLPHLLKLVSYAYERWTITVNQSESKRGAQQVVFYAGLYCSTITINYRIMNTRTYTVTPPHHPRLPVYQTHTKSFDTFGIFAELPAFEMF